MKITIFSDCHCGYDYGEERGEDPFLAFQEAMERSLDSDLILIAGDIFDSRVPKQEVLARAAKILSVAQNSPSQAKLVDVAGKDRNEVSPSALRGIPVVAIHGTHERRSRFMINPVQAMEHAGLLLHLHGSTALFDINGKKVAVHGMSGVPERFAGDCLKQWSPKPVPGACNILMLHQSVDPYVYSPLEPPSIRMEDLPAGFDLYVLGHMHWHDMRNFKSGTLLLTGSTVTTSVHKAESEQGKGMFTFNGTYLEFVPLASQRKVVCEQFLYSPEIRRQVEQKIIDVISQQHKMKPIIGIKIKGRLPPETAVPNFSDLEQKYGDRAIIKINQELKQSEFEKNMELLKTLRERGLSPEEQGLRILQDNLDQVKCGLNAHDMFDLLADGRIDEIMNMLFGGNK